MKAVGTIAACVGVLVFVGSMFVGAVIYTHNAQADMLERIEHEGGARP